MKHPLPWKLELCHFRMENSQTLVEVHDADGKVVLPWTAFDHLDTFYKKRMLAARIVNAINAQK